MNNFITSDQKVIKRIVKSSGSSFFWGMNILKPNRKRAMFAVYAFCRTVDDIADSELTFEQKSLYLNNWIKKIEKIYQGFSDDSLSRELKFSIEKYNLIKNDFLEIIDGMRIDAKKKIIYPTKKFLEVYCDKVAGAVGCLSIDIFGVENKFAGRNYAKYLGRALQLTNIIRDINEDNNRGRCYIYKEALTKNNIKMKPNELMKSEKLEIVRGEVFQLAEKYYFLADNEATKIDKRYIVASEIMKEMYFRLFQKMKKKKWNYKKRVRLSFYDKFFIIFSVLLRRKN